MNLELARRLFELLQEASAEEAARFISRLTQGDLLKVDALFEVWAHEAQLPPKGEGWRVWLLMAGRGFGKTRAGAEWVHALASAKPGLRIALVGASIADARTIMVEGVSGLLKVAGNYGRRLQWEPSFGRLTWPNGSTAQLFSGDHADGLRGPEHDVAWCDELAKWREADAAWDNLQFGLRRGPRPRALVTTTRRSIPLLTRIKADPWTAVTHGKTSDNVNLDQKFIEVMVATYGGTRLGRQELDGELIEDVEGALWTHEVIARSRAEMPEALDRIYVGVDPPAGASQGSDACGIVVADRSARRSTCSRMRRCRDCRPTVGPIAWRLRRRDGIRGWWWPRRTMAGRWSKAC